MDHDAKKGDLSVTALYTAQTWAWGGLSCAHLFATPRSKQVFDATNGALAAARLLRRDLPPLREGLLHRHAMIDHVVREAAPAEVLELAAGLSRRGAAFSADAALRYTEVDLPHVVAEKKRLLDSTAEGRAILARPNLRFVAADVEKASLDAWTTPGASLVVIAEGLLMYLSPDAQRALFRRVAELGARASAATFVFDLVPPCEQPRPGAVGRALEAAMKRFTGGRTFERDGRTRDDILRELREAGFAHAEAIEPADVATAWKLPHAGARTQQLVFVCRCR